MELPKIKPSGGWVDAELAKKFPEGSVVLIHRPARSKHSLSYLEVISCFRPVLVDNCYVRNRNDTTYFLLLEDNEIESS